MKTNSRLQELRAAAFRARTGKTVEDCRVKSSIEPKQLTASPRYFIRSREVQRKLLKWRKR